MNKLGFGFLRLPLLDGEIDYEKVNPMVDVAIAGGCNYFDTGYDYLDEKSEEAIRKSVVERYARSAFRLADKLPIFHLYSTKECEECFDIQLKRCGVDFFDVYLLHGLNVENYEMAKKVDAFGLLQKWKEQGKIKTLGFSYHDSHTLLDQILTEHPEMEIVQLQLNYLDWDSATIQSRLCYEVAKKHNKKVVVMEPVKGGTLADLPEEAMALLKPGHSPASYALRFAQSLENVAIVLSGMGTMEQLLENLQDVPPISDEEQEMLQKVTEILNRTIAVPCTGCAYCVNHCPQGIPIPNYFRIYNEYARRPGDAWKMLAPYWELGKKYALASACVGCQSCEAHCPQKLPISRHIKEVADALEKKA